MERVVIGAKDPCFNGSLTRLGEWLDFGMIPEPEQGGPGPPADDASALLAFFGDALQTGA